jgi:hypothetical protein
MVADRKLHVRPNGLYDPCKLMTEDGRQRDAEVVMGKMKVRMAQAGRLDLDQNLPADRAAMSISSISKRLPVAFKTGFHRFPPALLFLG